MKPVTPTRPPTKRGTRAEAERCLDRSVDWRAGIMHRKGTGKASCRARSLVEES